MIASFIFADLRVTLSTCAALHKGCSRQEAVVRSIMSSRLEIRAVGVSALMRFTVYFRILNTTLFSLGNHRPMVSFLPCVRSFTFPLHLQHFVSYYVSSGRQSTVSSATI